MLTRPLVKIELEVKNIRLQETFNVDSLFDESVQVIQEEVMRNEIVLVLTKISNDSLTSSVLVEVHSSVQSISIAVFLFFSFAFVNFVFVEDRVFGLKQVIKIVTKQVGHASRVKTQDWRHVSSIEL